MCRTFLRSFAAWFRHARCNQAGCAPRVSLFTRVAIIVSPARVPSLHTRRLKTIAMFPAEQARVGARSPDAASAESVEPAGFRQPSMPPHANFRGARDKPLLYLPISRIPLRRIRATVRRYHAAGGSYRRDRGRRRARYPGRCNRDPRGHIQRWARWAPARQ